MLAFPFAASILENHLVSERIQGTVVSVTDGRLITDITASQLENAPRDEQVSIRCDEHETAGIFGPDHDQPEATFIAVLGDADCLELQIVGHDASIMLGVRVGENVTVRW